jgi:hypothetical protein
MRSSLLPILLLLTACETVTDTDLVAYDGDKTCGISDSFQGATQVDISQLLQTGAILSGGDPQALASFESEVVVPEPASACAGLPPLTSPGKRVILRDGVCCVEILE